MTEGLHGGYQHNINYSHPASLAPPASPGALKKGSWSKPATAGFLTPSLSPSSIQARIFKSLLSSLLRGAPRSGPCSRRMLVEKESACSTGNLSFPATFSRAHVRMSSPLPVACLPPSDQHTDSFCIQLCLCLPPRQSASSRAHAPRSLFIRSVRPLKYVY